MINTYQTSLAPPPVPPRLNRSHPVLIPAPLPAQSSSRPMMRFLLCVVLLNLVLCVGGFIYLYHHLNMEQRFSSEGTVAFRAAEKQETLDRTRTMARMVVSKSSKESKLSYLQWDMDHSELKSINYYERSWLTIPESGDYYVYSRVTFSRGHDKLPLTSHVRLRKSQAEEDKTIMQACCDLDKISDIPRLCTASQGEVMTLEKGNQLSVWVSDLSLVSYEEGATTFGMYKL
ncbi:CD40 ligand [Betta splendens]|uniref:CD40 ligand n=1 Tax=Betta splendens TaxID=158456 RepID=A0A6P7NUB9_BETSP|nr:CD40 ligand [Betta splendens]